MVESIKKDNSSNKKDVKLKKDKDKKGESTEESK